MKRKDRKEIRDLVLDRMRKVIDNMMNNPDVIQRHPDETDAQCIQRVKRMMLEKKLGEPHQ